jgi:hypothetical protein
MIISVPLRPAGSSSTVLVPVRWNTIASVPIHPAA